MSLMINQWRYRRFAILKSITAKELYVPQNNEMSSRYPCFPFQRCGCYFLLSLQTWCSTGQAQRGSAGTTQVPLPSWFPSVWPQGNGHLRVDALCHLFCNGSWVLSEWDYHNTSWYKWHQDVQQSGIIWSGHADHGLAKISFTYDHVCKFLWESWYFCRHWTNSSSSMFEGSDDKFTLQNYTVLIIMQDTWSWGNL